MSAYRVVFENNEVMSVSKTEVARHGDISLNPDKTVKWYVVECEDADTARLVAASVVTEVWSAYSH